MSYGNSGSDEIVVPLHKGKTMAVALGSLAFVLTGIAMMAISGSHDGATRVYDVVVGLASILFFGLVFTYAASRLSSSSPTIVINARGITDNASAMGAGFVAWDEIASVHIGTTAGKRFLCLVPKDVPVFLARQPAWKRGAMEWNVSMVGAPITIAGTLTSISLDELQGLVMTHLRQAAPVPA